LLGRRRRGFVLRLGGLLRAGATGHRDGDNERKNKTAKLHQIDSNGLMGEIDG
jgi:hypothetical protein